MDKDRLLLLKTDCVVEGVHFLPNEKPSAVGWKAMMRTLSDFAAMSGLPQYALVTLISPAEREASWMTQLYRGLRHAADRFAVAIVGGETSATKGPLVVSISAIGSVEKKRCVRRSGGEVGDILFVTGKLGGSRRGGHLRFVPRIDESRWLTENFRIHAMMDLSDGLGADLPRLAKASGVGFAIDEEALPRTRGCSIAEAINDGEDYELLFAISPNDAEALKKKWCKKFPRLPLTCIGRFTRLASRIPHPDLHGFLHFQ
jgi:thiamine-monophosphate kinase